jgi:hypothetical protein
MLVVGIEPSMPFKNRTRDRIIADYPGIRVLF